MFYVQCIFYYSLLSIDLLVIDLMLYINNDWFLTLAISVSSQVAVLCGLIKRMRNLRAACVVL